ncbi:MAG TPA: TonB family protein [Caulobacterales bacterium]|nr:TonB family protein [Caulobacterales bacterium]
MANALGLRATSFGASTLVIAALAFGALTMTTKINLRDFGGPPPATIDVLIPPPPEPPPPVPKPQTPPPVAEPLAPSTPQRVAAVADTLPLETVVPIAHETGGPIEITEPRWTRRPSNLARYYPARAVARNIEGAVTLDCAVRTTGALECWVVSETPAGWGFAEAALRMSRDYAMVPAMRDGAPVEGRYRLRVPFALR